MKEWLKQHQRLKWFLIQSMNWFQQIVQANPLKWPKLPSELIWFARTRRKFKRTMPEGIPLHTFPILFQRGDLPFDAHYTYQAAWAMRRVLGLSPHEHVDISSDVRFVTLLSAQLPVRYFEFRPTHIALSNLMVCEGDLLNLPLEDQSVTSLSCLHVIEHIGLGRYGDPIDSHGHEKAFYELVRVLAPNGSLFFSTPVGMRKVLFNAHRIFDPLDVPAFAPELELVEFSIITTQSQFLENVAPELYRTEEYACGLYWFKRKNLSPRIGK